MTRAMKAGEVLDARTDLAERLEDPTFRRVLNVNAGLDLGHTSMEAFDDSALPDVAPLVARHLTVAEVYRVTHDMSMVVEHAANGLDELDRFDAALAPSGAGFVSFDRPLAVVDVRGKTMLVHYLVWGPTTTSLGPGTMVYAFNDAWRQPDDAQRGMDAEALEPVRRTMGRWASVGVAVYFKDQRLGPALLEPREERVKALEAEGILAHPGTNMLRHIHAMWLLMGQTVAKAEAEQVERHARRRAEKRKLPPKVTVIKLRREQSSERREGESMIEWAHRWVVRGHWRWQAVSAYHPLAQEIEPGKYRARIWINPFVKGPADKPIHQSEKVYSLER